MLACNGFGVSKYKGLGRGSLSLQPVFFGLSRIIRLLEQKILSISHLQGIGKRTTKECYLIVTSFFLFLRV